MRGSRRPVVDREFLETRHRELAVRLGLPIRKIVVSESALERNSYDLNVILLSPMVLSTLDSEEVTYMLTSDMLARREMERLLPKGKMPRTPHHMVWRIIWIPIAACVALFVLPVGRLAWWLAVVPIVSSILVVIWALMPTGKPMTPRRAFKKLKVMHKLHLINATGATNQFHEVLAITGNPSAGERYLRKSAKLTATDYGTLPFDDEAREFAEYSYRQNVPPEYQVKTPY
jgi:hypothetical protein